jgi:secondary thiamine-phosphate synthase enzyme
MYEYSIPTIDRMDMIDVIGIVRNAIHTSKIESGICVVFVPHTTAGVTINENADPAVKFDMIKEMDKIVPLDDHYRHEEGNSAAHIKSTMYSPSLTLIVEKGKPVLGTWQGIYFCEFDGPRTRRMYVKIIEG